MPNRGQWSVFEKDYLSGRDGVKPTSSWTFKDVNSERGSEQLIELGFAKEVFPNPKPVGTLQRLIQLGTSPQGEDIILDFLPVQPLRHKPSTNKTPRTVVHGSLFLFSCLKSLARLTLHIAQVSKPSRKSERSGLGVRRSLFRALLIASLHLTVIDRPTSE